MSKGLPADFARQALYRVLEGSSRGPARLQAADSNPRRPAATLPARRYYTNGFQPDSPVGVYDALQIGWVDHDVPMTFVTSCCAAQPPERVWRTLRDELVSLATGEPAPAWGDDGKER